MPDRFEKQLAVFVRNPAFSIVGGNIQEFIDVPENCVGKRVVPMGGCGYQNLYAEALPDESGNGYVSESRCDCGWRIYRLVL